jgi:DNA polymerase-1
MICFDTETTGLNPFKGDRVVAMSLYYPDGSSKYARVGQDDLVGPALELIGPDPKIAHNLLFDYQMLTTMGIELGGPCHDVMIMAHVFNPIENSLKLEYLAKTYLNHPLTQQINLKEYVHKHKIDVENRGYQDIPDEVLKPYAIEDVELTMKLFEFYKAKGILDHPTYKLEMRLMQTLIRMQRRGVLIDVDYCKETYELCVKRLSEIEEEVSRDHREMNLNSTHQIADYLFNDQGLICETFTEKGQPSLDAYNIQKYKHPIVDLIIEHREIAKIANTYFKGFMEKVDDRNVLHCNYFQVGARTGRISCFSPNLMNVPRDPAHSVRRSFVTRPGYTNYYFDYDQVELKVLAHYSQDPTMIRVLSDPDGDIHSETCQGIFKEVTKEKRTIAKSLNFGIIYGMGPSKFAMELNKDFPELGYTYSHAKQFIARYYGTYPKIRPFQNSVQRALLQRGYIHDIFGRRYYCEREFAYRAVNYLIQGCAAGILKQAMIDVDQLLQGKESNLLLTIHDELVVEIHDDEQHLVKEIKAIMEDRTTFRVPITVSVESSKTSWDAKESQSLLV